MSPSEAASPDVCGEADSSVSLRLELGSGEGNTGRCSHMKEWMT